MYRKLDTNLKGVVNAYLLLTTIRELSMSFFATTYVLFLINQGLNLFEVNMVNVVFFVTMFVFEIPTGVIADVLGRKISVIAGFFIPAIGMIMYFFADSFLICALAEAISAIGFTCITGAFDAWLVDELRHYGYQEKPRWIFARGQQLGRLAGLISAMIGAFLGNHNLALPWLASGFFMTLGTIIAILIMKETTFMPTSFSFKKNWQDMFKTFKIGMSYAKNNSPVRFLISMSIIQSLSFMAPNMQWTVWFNQLLDDTKNLGLIWWGVTLAMMAGSGCARIISNKWNEKTMLMLTQIGIGVCVAIASLSTMIGLSLIFFLLHELGRGFYRPIKDDYLNANIPSEQRATLISTEAMAFHFGGAFGLALSGAVANTFGITITWILSGIILIFGTLIVSKNHYHQNQ